MKEAKENARKLGGLSRGVIYDSNNGRLQIRIPKGEDILNQAKALLDPALAELVGKEMMNLPESSGTRYVIKGLASHWTMQDITKILMEELQWPTRPIRFIKSQTKNTNNLVVLATVKPPGKHFKWGTSWTSIVDYVADKPRRTAWHRAYESFFERYP